jgi:DNA-binding NarL/FixJ family response regulator
MIKLLIADDHAIMREGLKKIFSLAPDVEVAAEVSDGTAVIKYLQNGVDVDLLIMDFTMPGISGIALISQLTATHPTLPILVFSMHNQSQIASRSIKAGAAGYVVKDSSSEVLLEAIRTLARGGRYIDPKLVQQLAFDAVFPGQRAPHALLSDREFEVFRMLVSGKSANEIAAQFSISNKTVGTPQTPFDGKNEFHQPGRYGALCR